MDHAWAVRLKVIQNIAEGLKALHSNGFTHGDLKLENVLIFRSTDGTLTAKLSDFSLSTLPTYPPEHPSSYYGTWPWIPIEVLTNGCISDLGKCDVWAFAFVLWRVAQYRQDDSVELLEFVPESPEYYGSHIQNTWDTSKARFINELSTSSTIDECHREGLAKLFEHCVDSEPEKRLCINNIIQEVKNLVVSGGGYEEHEQSPSGNQLSDGKNEKLDPSDSPASQPHTPNPDKLLGGQEWHAMKQTINMSKVGHASLFSVILEVGRSHGLAPSQRIPSIISMIFFMGFFYIHLNPSAFF